ncbi:MAG: AraC family transcriptional regulator [Acinetobacter sp.]
MFGYENTADVIISLVNTVERLTVSDGDHQTAISRLSLHRRSEASTTHCIYHLGLGLVLQGEKQVIVGDQILHYAAGQMMLTTVDIPVISHTQCTAKHQPFLGLMLLLDIPMLAELVAEIKPMNQYKKMHSSFAIQSVDYALIESVSRLVHLLDETVLLPQLSPILQQEIMIRLLTGENGVYLCQLIQAGSVNQKIAGAVSWLKQNFVQSIRIDDLADQAFMSASTFRQRFREMTGMSPLQYQKQLRLQEARHLMLNRHLDVGYTASLVGYESASQFSREYSRLFGSAPQRDIQNLQSV